MKCQLHMEREAVSFCKDCKAPLCAECNSAFGPLCANCTEEAVQSGRKDVIITFGISAIAFALGLWWQIKGGYFKEDFVESVIICLLSIFLPFGWKGIGKITDFFLPIAGALGWMGMLLYFAFKLAAAVLLGWIFGIPKMIEMIKLWKTCTKADHLVKEMKMMPRSSVINE